MRLDRFISENTLYTRSETKKIIKKGVYVNGELIKKSDYKVTEGKDKVIIDGEEVIYRDFIYIMLNKPAGYLSATEDNRAKTVLDLINPIDKIKDIFPVGRLDKDTEGLILLTNNGDLAHRLTSPKKDVFKKYYVEVDGYLKKDFIESFREGIIIDGDYKCKSAILEILESKEERSSAYIHISEGKFHQIKKMMKAIELNVVYLKRLTIGNLVLDEKLDLGQYRYLSGEEIKILQ